MFRFVLFFVTLAMCGLAQAQAWQARHGMTAGQYQQTFDEMAKQGYRLTDVSGYAEGSEPHFAAIWVQTTGPAWQARHNLTSAQYQQAFDQMAQQGYRLLRVSGYGVGTQALYAAIWEQRQGPAWQARHGMTSAQYQQAFDQAGRDGYRLVHVNGYTVSGQDRYAAIWEQSPGPAWQARHGMTSAQYQQAFNDSATAGFRLTDVSGYAVGAADHYAAIWEKSPGPAWQARHGMTSAQYQQAFDQAVRDGYRLVHVSGYGVGGQARYAALWQK